MVKITSEQVKKLRRITGAGMVEVKAALTEAGGNLEKAAEILRKKGVIRAGKKTERSTGSGLIDSYIHDGRIGVLLEINCETDFVARNQEFKTLAHEIALHIASHNPSNIAELLEQPYARDSSVTIQELISQKVALLEENIKVRKFVRYVLGE